MERKMKRLNYRINMIEDSICYKTKQLNEQVEELKEYVAKCDVFQMVNFVPGRVRIIEELYNEIRELEEQKRIYDWIIKEDEE